MVISPDGQHVVSASGDGTLIIWDLASGEALQTLSMHPNIAYRLDISPDGQHLVSGSEDGSLIIWDLASGQAVATYSGEWSIGDYVFTPTGEIVAGDAGGKLHFLKLVQPEGKTI
jgi:WD40 repeat protein